MKVPDAGNTAASSPRSRRLPNSGAGGAAAGGAAAGGAAAGGAISILLCGERLRGDDAVAFAVASLLPDLITSRLPAAVRDRVTIVPADQLDLLVLLGLPAGSPCIVVDAVAGPAPGTVVVWPLAELAAELRHGVAPRSSHALPVDQVLALAATLRPDGLPGWFVGLAGERWGLGEQLSAPVAAALPFLAQAVVAAIAGFASPATDRP